MPYTPPEKPSQIDLTEKIDRAEFVRRCENSIIECTREMALASVAMAKPGMEMSMMLVSLVWQVKIPNLGDLIEKAKTCTHEAQLTIFETARRMVMENIQADVVRDLFPSAPRAQLMNTSATRDALTKEIAEGLKKQIDKYSDNATSLITKQMLERVTYGVDIGREGGDSSCITTFKVFSDGTRDLVSVIEYKGDEPKRVAFITGMAFHSIVQGYAAKNKPTPGEVAIRDADFKALFADPSVSPYVRDIGECDAAVRARATSHFASQRYTINQRFKDFPTSLRMPVDPVNPDAHDVAKQFQRDISKLTKPVEAYSQGDPRAQFRALVLIAQGMKLEACAKAVGTYRLDGGFLETDSMLRQRVLKCVDNGCEIGNFTYTEKL